MPEPVKQPLPSQLSGVLPDQGISQISVAPRPEAGPIPLVPEQRVVGEVGEYIAPSNSLPRPDASVAPFAQPVQIARLPQEQVSVVLPPDPVIDAKAQIAQGELMSKGRVEEGRTWVGRFLEFVGGKKLLKLEKPKGI